MTSRCRGSLPFRYAKWLVGGNGDTLVAVSPPRLVNASEVVTIAADVHERASGIPSMLASLGACVTVQALTRGDYVVDASTIVERKSVRDLHASIAAGRFWHQLRRLGADGTRPYLL